MSAIIALTDCTKAKNFSHKIRLKLNFGRRKPVLVWLVRRALASARSITAGVSVSKPHELRFWANRIQSAVNASAARVEISLLKIRRSASVAADQSSRNRSSGVFGSASPVQPRLNASTNSWHTSSVIVPYLSSAQAKSKQA
jgi:hypothetical protein